jgi:hypothetical protein
MSDGIRLSATLYLPDRDRGPWPTILEYLPYRKDDGTLQRDLELYPYVVDRGYVGARVDVRGTGRSEGRLPEGEYTEQEQADGVAVIAWLAAQAWCNRAGQGPLRVGHPPAHHGRSEPGEVEDLPGEGRHRPVGLLGRLNVVHPVTDQSGGARGAGEVAENHGVTGGLHQLGRATGVLDQGSDSVGDIADPFPRSADRRHPAQLADPFQVDVEPLVDQPGDVRRPSPVPRSLDPHGPP